MSKDIYSQIESNTKKTILLVLAFPFAFGLIMYGLLLLFCSFEEANQVILITFPIILVICLIWTLISLCCGDQMMLGFAHATELSGDGTTNKRVYRSVENVALAAGLPTPRVYIIDDESLNAFATGTSPKTASIALTTGIINKLKPLELEAVIAHEMGHVGNRDTRLNIIIITCLGVFGLLADILIRMYYSSSRSSNSKDGNQYQLVILLIWLGLLIFNAIIAPIIQFALSRTREYQADATSAFITRNPDALISALEKISEDSRVEVLDKSKLMGSACIADPTEKAGKSAFAGIGKTHPSVKNRIKRLTAMKGKFDTES